MRQRSTAQKLVAALITAIILILPIVIIIKVIGYRRDVERIIETRERCRVPLKVEGFKYDSLIVYRKGRYRAKSYDDAIYQVTLVDAYHPMLGSTERATMDLFFYHDGGDGYSYRYLKIYLPDEWCNKPYRRD